MVFFGYTIYVFIRKRTLEDQLLEPQGRKTSKVYIREKVEILEGIDSPYAEKATQRIAKVLSKKTSNDNKLSNFDDIVKLYVFEGFKKRFIAFNKADLGLKYLLIWAGINGFLVFGIIILGIADQNDLTINESIPLVFLSCILLFIIPLLFGLFWSFSMYLWFGTLKSLFKMLGFSAGKLARTQLLIEEHIVSLKPGGRSTVITFQGGIKI